MVAAWIKADTGVGPTIASDNQVCNGNCADLAITPINKKNAIQFILKLSTWIKCDRKLISWKLNVLYLKYIYFKESIKNML